MGLSPDHWPPPLLVPTASSHTPRFDALGLLLPRCLAWADVFGTSQELHNDAPQPSLPPCCAPRLLLQVAFSAVLKLLGGMLSQCALRIQPQLQGLVSGVEAALHSEGCWLQSPSNSAPGLCFPKLAAVQGRGPCR